MEHRRPVFKVMLATKAAAAVVVFRRKVHLDRLDPMVNLVKMEDMENQDRTVPMDLNDHKWHHSRIGVSLAGTDLKAKLEGLDLKARLDRLEHPEKTPTEDIVDRPDKWDPLDHPVRTANLANPERKVPMDRSSISPELPDQLGQLDHKARLALMANLDPMVTQAKMDKWDQWAMLAKMVVMENLAKRDVTEKPDLMVQPVLVTIAHHLALHPVIDDKTSNLMVLLIIEVKFLVLR